MTKKQIEIGGVAVYPDFIPPSGKVHVGVWVERPMSRTQCAELMRLNDTAGLGHVGVCRVGFGNSKVSYIGPAARRETDRDTTPKKIAARLAQAVQSVTGTRIIVRRLPNNQAVSRALPS